MLSADNFFLTVNGEGATPCCGAGRRGKSGGNEDFEWLCPSPAHDSGEANSTLGPV
jgi:hypothetical protein